MNHFNADTKARTRTAMKPNILAASIRAAGRSLAAAIFFVTAAAQAQTLFVADSSSGSIYEFTTNGTRSTFASGLNYPRGLAINRAGNLFEADTGSGKIYEFTTNGIQSTFASGLNTPVFLTFDAAGNLFETDNGSGNIYEFTTNGVRTTVASGLSNGTGLAFDSNGNLFAAAYGSGNIYEFTNYNGALSANPVIFASGLNKPNGLAINSSGDLFVALEEGTVYEFTPGGVRSTFASGLSTFLIGIMVDGAGNVFVSQAPSPSADIIEFTPAGSKTTFTTQVSYPQGLALSYPPAGVSIGLCPMLLITGVVGTPITIQRSTNVANPNSWVSITNLTLTTSAEIWADTSINTTLPGNPHQFYRVQTWQ